MFKNDLRLYVYPSLAVGGQVLNARNLQVAGHLQSLYEYLLSNGFIRRIEGFREDYLSILSRDALKQIRSGDPQWEQSVPESVAQLIRERGLLGYQSAADPQPPRKTLWLKNTAIKTPRKYSWPTATRRPASHERSAPSHWLSRHDRGYRHNGYRAPAQRTIRRRCGGP